jgi:hypothetical protein
MAVTPLWQPVSAREPHAAKRMRAMAKTINRLFSADL